MPLPRILIIDDDRMTRQLLTRLLSQRGFEAIDCAGAYEALPLIESARPMLIVSDYEMPDATGAQLCELVRAHADPEIAELPIILLTAHTDEDHEVECLRAGANDFVSKPVNATILKARIETHLRLHALRAQLQGQNTELEQWRHRHEKDLEAAQITQQAILPARLPRLDGWEVAAHYQPVIHVGGDMYDWQRLRDGGWLFWIADATGHGASAALITTLTKLIFRHAAEEADPDAASILRAANAGFFSILKGKSFMTAACVVVRPGSGRVCFAGAGHPPLLVRRATGATELITSSSPPLGIVADLDCRQLPAELAAGDIALLYTDGLYSVPAADGSHLNPEDLSEIVPRGSGASAAEFVERTIAGLQTADDGPLPDDVALVALRRQ